MVYPRGGEGGSSGDFDKASVPGGVAFDTKKLHT